MFGENWLSAEDWSWRRVTGILGILFFILFAVAIFTFLSQPSPDEPISEIREYFTDDDALIHTGNWIAVLAFLFLFLPFAAGLRSALDESDVDAGMWSRAAYGIAVALVAVGGTGSAFFSSAALAVSDLDDAALRLVMYLDASIFLTVIPFGAALFLIATSIVVLRTGALWKWLGWLGLLIALVSLIGTFWPFDGDPEGVLVGLSFTGFMLFVIWVLLAGINLVTGARSAAE